MIWTELESRSIGASASPSSSIYILSGILAFFAICLDLWPIGLGLSILLNYS